MGVPFASTGSPCAFTKPPLPSDVPRLNPSPPVPGSTAAFDVGGPVTGATNALTPDPVVAAVTVAVVEMSRPLARDCTVFIPPMLLTANACGSFCQAANSAWFANDNDPPGRLTLNR